MAAGREISPALAPQETSLRLTPVRSVSSRPTTDNQPEPREHPMNPPSTSPEVGLRC